MPFNTPRREIIDLLPASFGKASSGDRSAALVRLQQHHLEIRFRQV
jgi:hypothetical protein